MYCTKNWIYSHLLMSKYDANAVQMCGKHGKCRIYSHIYMVIRLLILIVLDYKTVGFAVCGLKIGLA